MDWDTLYFFNIFTPKKNTVKKKQKIARQEYES